MLYQPDFKATTALSFDIYGTLLDWESGVLKSLLPLTSQLETTHPCYPTSPTHHDSTIAAFNEHEIRIIKDEPKILYHNALTEAYKCLAAQWGLEADPMEASAVAASIKDWPAFPDTIEAMNKLGKRFKLIALSNISHDAFAMTMQNALKDVKFDATYLAEDIGSYKPDRNNFEYLLSHAEKDLGVKKEQMVHVAHGARTDQVPAEEIGLEHVWIRRGKDNFKGTAAETYQGQYTFETLGDMANELVR